ncbi:acetyl-CoA carboxylase, biotin carboxyl carrier protein, partial [Paracoccus aestuarii]
MSNDSNPDKHHDGDVAFIRSLAELLNASELNEIQVKREYGEHDRLTVSLTKQGKQVVYAQAPQQ